MVLTRFLTNPSGAKTPPGLSIAKLPGVAKGHTDVRILFLLWALRWLRFFKTCTVGIRIYQVCLKMGDEPHRYNVHRYNVYTVYIMYIYIQYIMGKWEETIGFWCASTYRVFRQTDARGRPKPNLGASLGYIHVQQFGEFLHGERGPILTILKYIWSVCLMKYIYAIY